MAPQVWRIAVVFTVVFGIFLGVKSLLSPAGFGEEGFYRKQGPSLVASSPARHAGMTACLDCHPDKPDATFHVKKGVRCESCHGAAQAHVDDYEKFKPPIPTERADCTRCHATIVARPDWYPQIDPKVHNPDIACSSCHLVHEAQTEVNP